FANRGIALGLSRNNKQDHPADGLLRHNCRLSLPPIMLVAQIVRSTRYAPAASAAPRGRVVTQASRIVPIIFELAVRLTSPMPNNEPTATCVVDTGKPRRLAPATSR